MCKIFVLGLDGLEHSLVEEWNLKSFKQNEYGKISVPITKKYNQPTTPHVWASFLTGKNNPLVFKTTPLRKMRNLANRINSRLRMVLKRIIPKRLTTMEVSFPKLGERTFIDLAKSKEIGAPFYSYRYQKVAEVTHSLDAGNISLLQAINTIKRFYEYDKKYLLKEAGNIKDEDIIFAYLHFPDLLSHFYWLRPPKLKAHYIDLANFTAKLKKRIFCDRFIIVSDHGFNIKVETIQIMVFM